jgi:hypothetical protein
MTPPATDLRTRGRGDRGAGIVEFALVAPVLILFLLGIMEYGMMYRESNQVEQGLMSAGRVAGQQSTAWTADYETLRSLSSSTNGLGRSTVKRVIIYKAPADGKPPAGCLAINPTGTTAGVSGVCNVYNATQMMNENPFAFSNVSSCSGLFASNWCALTRQPQTDEIGVYVEMSYQRLTGIIPGTFTVKKWAVYDVEPFPIGS